MLLQDDVCIADVFPICSAAKNVVLAGVRSLTLHDDQPVTWADLSAQFDLTEANLGQNRAEASKNHLQELNTAVAVTASQEPLTEAVLSHFQARHLLMQAVGLLGTNCIGWADCYLA